MNRNIIILLGGPGSGKGTQAAGISTWLGVPHISTGQLLRTEAVGLTPLGLEARAAMEAGQLVDDDIVDAMVSRRTQVPDCVRGFILDGYPRDTSQAVTFGSVAPAGDRLLVIDIVTNLDAVLPRLTGRRTCRDCNRIYHLVTSPPCYEGVCDRCGGPLVQRPDDHEDVIRERFRTYHRLTEPLTRLYQQWGIYNRIDGMQTADRVGSDIRELLYRAIPGSNPGGRWRTIPARSAALSSHV